MPNEIYDFLVKNNLTQKSESEFKSEYSVGAKAKELHNFFVSNNLTTKDYDSFYNEYLSTGEMHGATKRALDAANEYKESLKKKDVSESPSGDGSSVFQNLERTAFSENLEKSKEQEAKSVQEQLNPKTPMSVGVNLSTPEEIKETFKKEEETPKDLTAYEQDLNSNINWRTIGVNEERVVKFLNEKYGDDFIFEEATVGQNAITVRSLDRLNEMSIPVGGSTAGAVKNPTVDDSVEKLRSFLANNKPSKSREAFIKANDKMTNLRFEERKALMEDIDKRMFPVGTTAMTDGIEDPALRERREIEFTPEEIKEMGKIFETQKQYLSTKASAHSQDIRKSVKDGKITNEDVARDLRTTIGSMDGLAMENYNKNISREMSDIAVSVQRLNEEKQAIDSRTEALQEKINQFGVTPEIQEEANILEQDIAAYNQYSNSVQAASAELIDIQEGIVDAAVLSSMVKEDEGNLVGAITNGFIKGATNVARLSGMSKSEQEQFIKWLGDPTVSAEWMSSEDRGFWEKLLPSLSESVGVMASSALTGPAAAATSYAGFYAQSYYGLKDEMDSMDTFKGVPEYEKEALAAVYGMTVGLLERYGITKSMKVGKNTRAIADAVLKRTFSQIPKNASTELLEQEIKGNIKAMIANGTMKMIGASITEGATEATQELLDIGIKEGYNAMKGKNLFEHTGSDDILSRVAESALMGMVGGAIFSGVGQATSAVGSKLSDTQLPPDLAKTIQLIGTDGKFRSLMTNYVKSEMMAGRIDKEQAKDMLFKYDEMMGQMNKIPSNVEQVIEAFDLITEKEKIKKDIEGKEKSLVTKEQDRINQIDEQLKTISENTGQVTEQVTGQVNKSEAVSEAVSEAASETEVVTEEGKKEVSKPKQGVVFNRENRLQSATEIKQVERATQEDSERISGIADASQNVVNSIEFEGDGVVLHETQESYQEAVAKTEGVAKEKIAEEEAGGRRSAGSFTVDGVIHIDMSNPKADAKTVYHEATHAGLLQKKVAPKAMPEMAQAIKDIVVDQKKEGEDTSMLEKLDNFVSQYTNEDGYTDPDRAEEFLSELGGMLSSGEYDALSTSTWQKIAVAINNIVKKYLGESIAPFSERASKQEVVDFMNTMSSKMKRAESIADVKVPDMASKNYEDVVSKRKLQANFSHVPSGFTFEYLKNDDQFNKLKEDGYITEDKTMEDFGGLMILHAPDAAFSGDIYKNGEQIVEGKGGVYYPIKYHDQGYFWASTENAANKMAADLNEMRKQSPDGKIKMALVSAPIDKLMSSSLNSIGLMDILTSKSFDEKSGITENQVKRAIAYAVKTVTKLQKEGKEGLKPAQQLPPSVKATDDINEIRSKMREFFAADVSAFPMRKAFNSYLLDGIAKVVKSQKTKDQLLDFLGAGTFNPKLKSTGGRLSKANLKEGFSNLLAEPTLKEEGSGKIYAVIELDGDVEAVKTADHESYPFAMKSVDPNKKVTLNILKDRVDWREHAIDPQTGEAVINNPERANNVLPPSAGVSGAVEITKSKRKKQISGNGKNKAMDDAKAKYELSKKRGNSEAQARKSAIADLKKNDWYKEATDIERENAVRELKEELGFKKGKKAPSAAKILGKPKPKKVEVSEIAALKDQIRLEAKSAREAAKSEKDVRKKIAKTLKDMMEKAPRIFNQKQVTAIVQRALGVNLSNPVMEKRFIEYVDKVYKDAEYIAKEQEAIKMQRKIKRLTRKKGNKQNTNYTVGKAFGRINPSLVEDIDEYMAVANEVINALGKSRLFGADVIFRNMPNLGDISTYIENEIARQEEIEKNTLLELFPELVEAGVINDNQSLSQIREILKAIQQKDDVGLTEEQQQDIIDAVSERFADVQDITRQMVESGVDPFTGEPIVLSKVEKNALKNMLDVDLGDLSVKQALELVDVMTNFITNGVTDNIDSITAVIEGNKNAKIAEGMLKPEYKDKNWKITRAYDAMFATLPLFLEKITGSPTMAGRLADLMGINEYREGVVRATREVAKVKNEYSDRFEKTKPNGLHFRSAENVYERGMYAFLTRNISGTKEEQITEFNRRVKLMRDSITFLTSNSKRVTDDMRRKGEMYQKVAENMGLFDEGLTILDIESRVNKTNKEAVNFWIDKWMDSYSEVSDVAKTVYNKELGQDQNYIPDTYRKVDQIGEFDPDNMELARFDDVVGQEAGSLKDIVRPENLPKTTTGAIDRYVDLSFDMNNAGAYEAALTDVYTARAARKIKGFLNSKEFNEMFTAENQAILKGKIISFAQSARGKDRQRELEEQTIRKVANSISKMAVSLGLGGITQIVKQTVPVMVATAMQTRRGSTGVLDYWKDRDAVNTWLSENNADVSIRGLESETVAKMSDRQRLKVEKKLEKLKDKPDKMVEFYLKTFLQKGDVGIAKASFIAHYKTALERLGKSTDIDFSKPMDPDAKAYAQQMLDRHQNVSIGGLQGQAFTNSNVWADVGRKVLMPFANFVINAKVRTAADIKTLTSQGVDSKDKWNAARSVGGTVMEIAVYRAMASAINGGIQSLAYSFAGYDPEDDDPEINKEVEKENNRRIKDPNLEPMTDTEEREFRQKLLSDRWWENFYKTSVTQAVTDLFSPMPPFDAAVLKGSNAMIKPLTEPSKSDIAQAVIEENERRADLKMKAMTKEEREKFEDDYKDKHTFQLWGNTFGEGGYGMYSIPTDKSAETYKYAFAATEGIIETESNMGKSKRYLSDRDKEIAKIGTFAKLLYMSRIAPTEVGYAADKLMKAVEKSSMTPKQNTEYRDAISFLNTIGADELTQEEENMIKAGSSGFESIVESRMATGVDKDIIKRMVVINEISDVSGLPKSEVIERIGKKDIDGSVMDLFKDEIEDFNKRSATFNAAKKKYEISEIEELKKVVR